jgi:hypothetical protein
MSQQKRKSSENNNDNEHKKIKNTCYGCANDKFMLNQLAHCEPGGCLYMSSDESSDNESSDNENSNKNDDKSSNNKNDNVDDADDADDNNNKNVISQCTGCLNDEPNLEAHQQKNGCEYVDVLL